MFSINQYIQLTEQSQWSQQEIVLYTCSSKEINLLSPLVITIPSE